ncbi:hypothetical protein LTR22_022430 [Elasticomyces elasticus]|nr:hypothetical protein LTR22_022430 [Elasticomyces elasticus]
MESRMSTPLSQSDSSEKFDDYSEKMSSESDHSKMSPVDSPRDLEAQAFLGDANQTEAGSTVPQQVAHEHRTSFSTKLAFLVVYFFLNLTLTVSNKAILGSVRFPWLLTTLHASATSIGCFALMGMGYLEVKRLNTRETLVYGRTYSKETYISMIPLILGVALATAGDYYATLIGFLLTALGVVLAAIKTVATNRLITGKFSPMEVLLLMSPLAAMQCAVYAFANGEVAAVRIAIADGAFSSPMLGYGLAANACIAFALNIVSFQTNKVAGALTISVCGNVKQALTIMLGIVLFHVHVGLVNGFGMIVTLGGAAYYSKVELDTKRSKSQPKK